MLAQKFLNDVTIPCNVLDILAEMSCPELRTLCESVEACREIEKCCPFSQYKNHTPTDSGMSHSFRIKIVVM